jgi:RNA polymerase primary sigma factor
MRSEAVRGMVAGMSDALAPYLAMAARHPVLSAAEERQLGRRAAAGDAAARRRLVESNLRLVVAIARRYRGLGIDLADLVQEGNIGLMEAAERFDPGRGVRFGTYSAHWVRREICLALSTKSRLVRLPRRVAEASTRVKRAERELSQQLGGVPAAAAVARSAGVEEEIVLLLRRSEAAPVSLSEPGAEALFGTEDDPDPEPARPVDIRGVLSRLEARTRRIVELRFGLDGRAPRTLAQVAGELGVSRQRVTLLESRALRDLARRLEPQMAAVA